jgi:hypothetical protein
MTDACKWTFTNAESHHTVEEMRSASWAIDETGTPVLSSSVASNPEMEIGDTVRFIGGNAEFRGVVEISDDINVLISLSNKFKIDGVSYVVRIDTEVPGWSVIVTPE